MPVTTGSTAATLDAAELFLRWRRDGDQVARDRLIEHHLPLARRLARRYASSGEPLEDLTQIASLGLVKAVERFDPGRGFAFTSFAVPTIVGELKRYFRDATWALHVDRSAQERARRVIDAQAQLTTAAGRPPTIPEIAQYLETDDEYVLDGLQTATAYDAVSLDAPLTRDGEDELSRLEMLGGHDERLSAVDDHSLLYTATRHLPVREREILYLRFGEDLTQTEIAERIGVSQMQVSRLLRRSLARLRELTAHR